MNHTRIGLGLALLVGAAVSGVAATDDYTTIIAGKISVEKYYEERLQGILSALLGPDRVRVFVQADLKVEKTESKQASEAAKRKEERSKYLAIQQESPQLMPGIPMKQDPGRMGEGTGQKPSNTEDQSSGQTRAVVDIPSLIKRLMITIWIDDRVPSSLVEVVKKTVSTAIEINPRRGDKLIVELVPFISPTAFARRDWMGLVFRPWVLVTLFGTGLLSAFLFGPFAGFLKTLGANIGKAPGAEINLQQAPGGAAGPGGSTGGGANPAADLMKALAAGMPGLEGVDLEGATTLDEVKARLAEARGRAGAGGGGEERPFAFVRQDSLQSLIYLLQDEAPDTVALVLTYLKPEFAAEVITALSPERQMDLAMSLAAVKQATAEQVRGLEADLRRKVDFLVGGMDRFMGVLDQLDKPVRENILSALDQNSPVIAGKVRETLVSFESMGNLPNFAVQLVLRDIKTEALAVALKNLPQDHKVYQKIMENLSENARALLREEMEFGRPVSPGQIEEEQKKILQHMKRLESEGKIVLAGKRGRIGIEGRVEALDLSERLGLALQASAGSAAPAPGAYAEAQSVYEAGRYEDAASKFRTILRADRRNVGAWQYLGGALYALGRLPEALEAYEQALALNPGDESFRSWVAELRQTVEALPSEAGASALPAPAGPGGTI